jgi:uncharacterized coiled-coil DUF342 family protein
MAHDEIDELREKVHTTEKSLQEIAAQKKEAKELTEKRNQLNKQLQQVKTSIEQKESVLFAPYMEATDPQQTIAFD